MVDCIFCSYSRNFRVIRETAMNVVVEDNFPVSPGHMLVVPRKHITSVQEMRFDDWVRLLRDQCQFEGVPFFFKQRFEEGKKVSMPELDGQVWGQWPKVVE